MLAVISEVPTALGESSTRLAVDAGSIPATSTQRQECRSRSEVTKPKMLRSEAAGTLGTKTLGRKAGPRGLT